MSSFLEDELTHLFIEISLLAMSSFLLALFAMLPELGWELPAKQLSLSFSETPVLNELKQ